MQTRGKITKPSARALGLILLGILTIALKLDALAAETPQTISIKAGSFITGSDNHEREQAYQLDEAAYGHSVTRKNGWYDSEAERMQVNLPAFHIMQTLVTNAQYAEFVNETGHRPPEVSEKQWKSYGLIHPFKRTRRHAWEGGNFPPYREHHPVVLVSFNDADAFAKWLSEKTGKSWRLPTEHEWEKAARGPDGHWFPWGNKYDPAKLNSHDSGPFDTLPVGTYPLGNSPFGMADAAGQVFEWTSTPSGEDRYRVKGGSWDDKGCGVCRPAARHDRPKFLKHILIGFRLVQEELTVK